MAEPPAEEFCPDVEASASEAALATIASALWSPEHVGGNSGLLAQEYEPVMLRCGNRGGVDCLCCKQRL